MVIFLPLLLMLLVLGAIRGETNVILVLPMCLMLALGAVYVAIALRDGRRKKDPSIPVLATNPLSRRLHSALRTKPPERPAPSPSKGWTPPRSRRRRAQRPRSL
jgi:hypothetical protein